MDSTDPDLIDFIMRMCRVDPTKRMSAREALRHDWLVGPLLGYWAVAGIKWVPPEGGTGQEETRDAVPEKTMESVEMQERRLPRFYDFTNSRDDDDIEESDEEVSLVYAGSSPVPFLDLTAQEEVTCRSCPTDCSGGGR